MNTLSLSVERQVRCWCGNAQLEDFSPDYWRCPECQTLVLREMRGPEISQVRDDDQDFYGKNYYLHHVQEDYGLPDLETRARVDLPERCLHWLRTTLKFVPGAGARTLELGCGHGGFVAMQRWAGLDATGLELSPWLVEQARKWFDVQVLEGRLEDQDLAAGSFDAVMMMDVLEHLPDPRQTLTRAVSLLRSPESFLLIQTPCYPAGVSYETLVAQDHPFLIQLKPLEHLYLFSKQAVQRLCAEIGIGQVRFEPAIFAHYDLFAVASANALRERDNLERAEMLRNAPPPARAMLALLDMGQARDDLHRQLADLSAEYDAALETAHRQSEEITKLHAASAEFWPRLDLAENARNLLGAQLADAQRQFESVERDNKARLEVIERQGAEISRLNAEVTRWLEEASALWRQINDGKNARDLLALQLAEAQRQFASVEADNAARLEVIETQGAEIARLNAEVTRWLQEAGALWPRLNAAENARNLQAAQYEDLHGHYERSEEDRAARLRVIEMQGAENSRLAGELNQWQERAANLQREADELRSQLDAAVADARALDSRLAEQRSVADGLQARQRRLDKHWSTRLLKKLRLGPG